MRQARLTVVAVVVALAALPEVAAAQYFGQNQVQYQTFDWQILNTDHLDIYFYPEERAAVEDAARMGERWYTRLSRVFNHEFRSSNPVVLYANHPDFQQTNTTDHALGEGTGGFTESLRNRVVMPLTGLYAENDHILGHELVHAFQYDIAERMGALNQQGLGRLPLWLIEGMAEYLSVGREDPHTAMWLRDAALRGDLPTIRQLTSDPRYFPYRYGQGLWAYVGGRWGDRAVTDMYKASLRYGWGGALQRVLRTTEEQLDRDWMESIRATYLPLMQGRDRPEDISTRVLARELGAGDMNLGPSLSPDGQFVAFYSERDLFEVGLFMANARTGEIIDKLADTQSDIHFDALSFLSSAGAWSPDGTHMAFTVFARGNEELAILRVSDQRVVQRVRIRGVGAINTPSWSPDGRSIAVSGNRGGVTDLYVVDIETGAVQQLTDDAYADLQPQWSPDGRTLAFVTDRAGTDLDALTYGNMRIGLIDVATRRIEMLDLFASGKHIDPKFSGDGEQVYFISDADGFTDIYRVTLATGEIDRLTRLATGVSGVTRMSPALTIAPATGDIMFSVFSQGNYAVYRMEAAAVEAQARPVTQRYAGVQPAGVLPPVEGTDRGIVASYLDDPLRGMPARGEFPVEAYRPRLSLDYLGVPTVGVSVGGPFGAGFAGAVSGYFSDMLGNRRLGVAVQANGGVRDIGAQAIYQNREGLWNWGVLGAHVPYQSAGAVIRFADPSLPPSEQIDTLEYQIFRIYQTQAAGMLERPLSRTRRWEFSGGFTRIGFGLEALRIFYDAAGRERGTERTDIELPENYDAVNLGTGSVAYVGDWSNFGFTSPVRGGRFRFEVSPMIGDIKIATGLADYRRYFYNYPFTLAVRGMHVGRYGPDAEESSILLQQLFLGRQDRIRGYAWGSWSQAECLDAEGLRDPQCRTYTRLFGSRLGVANVEARVPLFGIPEYGLINFPFLPTELSAFFDIGVAWRSQSACEGAAADPLGCSPTFDWSNPIARTPLASAGLSTRMNVLGFAVLEIYYAYPFQRPEKGAHFGWQLMPGW